MPEAAPFTSPARTPAESLRSSRWGDLPRIDCGHALHFTLPLEQCSELLVLPEIGERLAHLIDQSCATDHRLAEWDRLESPVVLAPVQALADLNGAGALGQLSGFRVCGLFLRHASSVVGGP